MRETVQKSRPPHKTPFKPSAQQGYYLYGWHAVVAALGNQRRQHKKLLFTTEMQTKCQQEGLKVSFQTEIVAKSDLDKILPKEAVHQGIALLTSALDQPVLESFIEEHDKSTLCLVILDQVTDPHNVGAILRSAAAFGAAAVVVQARHSPEETPLLAKSASGALERIPYIQVTNISRTLEYLKSQEFWCLGLDADGRQALHEMAIPAKVALVFGAEGDGLRRLTKENCDTLVRVPTADNFSSLNVSNAVAVSLFETFRQQTAA